jgi:hypothetical protein
LGWLVTATRRSSRPAPDLGAPDGVSEELRGAESPLRLCYGRMTGDLFEVTGSLFAYDGGWTIWIVLAFVLGSATSSTKWSRSLHGSPRAERTMDAEQVSIIRTAHLMLQTLTTTFSNPSTNDPIRLSAAQNFQTLLDRARAAFPTIAALKTIRAPGTGDALPGLISALSMLVGALPEPPAPPERPRA